MLTMSPLIEHGPAGKFVIDWQDKIQQHHIRIPQERVEFARSVKKDIDNDENGVAYLLYEDPAEAYFMRIKIARDMKTVFNTPVQTAIRVDKDDKIFLLVRFKPPSQTK